MSRLDEIKARSAAATPGPWRNDPAGPGGSLESTGEDVAGFWTHGPDYVDDGDAYYWNHGDGEFIAHSRADVDWLVERVEELSAALLALADMTDQALALIDEYPNVPPSDSTVVLRTIGLSNARAALKENPE